MEQISVVVYWKSGRKGMSVVRNQCKHYTIIHAMQMHCYFAIEMHWEQGKCNCQWLKIKANSMLKIGIFQDLIADLGYYLLS